MPTVPQSERKTYSIWAKNKHKPPIDKHNWVHESDYSDFARREEDKS